MFQVVWTQTARLDLLQILRYIVERSPACRTHDQERD